MSLLRSDAVCFVFGAARDLPTNTLPTYEDVTLCYLWVSRNKQKQGQYKNLVSDICLEVSVKITRQWELASIPTTDDRSVVRKIKDYHDKYRNLLKPYSSRKNVESYKERMKIFKQEAQVLFDKATCKCLDSCKFDKAVKVPIHE